MHQKTRIEACRETARLLDLGVSNAIASAAATPDLGGACAARRQARPLPSRAKLAGSGIAVVSAMGSRGAKYA